MTSDTEAPRPWVEVVEKTLILALVDDNGKPVRLSYIIREHLGDAIQALPGGIKISRPSQDIMKDGEMYRVKGEEIVLNAAHVVGIETTYRLEKRARMTPLEMLKQPSVKEVEERLAQHNREMREK